MRKLVLSLILAYLLNVQYGVYNQNTTTICSSSTDFYSYFYDNGTFRDPKKSYLNPGWYHFGSGNQILLGVNNSNSYTCPQVGKCSLSYTLWTLDAHPTILRPDELNITLCESKSKTGNDSSCASNNLCVRKIRTVYCLVHKSFSYYINEYLTYETKDCYGITRPTPCAAGFASPTGYEPGCTQIEFDFNQLARSAQIEGVTNAMDNQTTAGQLSFRCSIPCPAKAGNCTQITGTVSWIFNNNIFATNRLKYNPNNGLFYDIIPESTWTPYLNQEISCLILPKYNDKMPSFEIRSVNHYLGIKCQILSESFAVSTATQLILILSEGNLLPAKLKCESTLPIQCVNSSVTTCNLQLWINYKNMSNGNNRVVTKECITKSNGVRSCEACQKVYSPGLSFTQLDREKLWEINVNMEAKNLNFKNELYQIIIYSNKNSTDLRPFYNNITLPDITISFQNKSRPLRISAQCYNDPHCVTFDGKWFEFHRQGEYQMYENVETQTRVHLINKECSTLKSSFVPYCINKLYIQSLYEVVKLDLENSVFYYTNLKTGQFDVPIIFKNGVTLNTFDQIIVTQSGYSIEVETPYGLVLKVNGYYYSFKDMFYYFGFTIIPSKGDNGKTNGIFGNWNGDLNDDMKYLRNTQKIDTNDQIFESFKAGTVAGIPAFSNGQYYTVNPVSLQEEHNYCECLRLNPQNNPVGNCKVGLNQKKFNGPIKSAKTSIEYVELSQADEEINFSALTKTVSYNLLIKENLKMYHETRVKRQSNPQTNSNSCDAMLTNQVFLQLNSSGVIDLNSIVLNCRLDYTYDPNTDWSVGHVQNTNSILNTILQGDATQMTLDASGNLVANNNLNNVCPNDCSSKGTCNNGVCNCNNGFASPDCSINLAEAPVVLRTLYENNKYDFSSVALKDAILVMNKFYADNVNSVVKMSVLTRQSTSAIFSELVPSTTLSPLSINRNTIFLNLTNPLSSVTNGYFFLKFEASNNNINFSSPVYMTAYDSRSYICDNNFSCSKIGTSTQVTVKNGSGSARLTQINMISLILISIMILF